MIDVKNEYLAEIFLVFKVYKEMYMFDKVDQIIISRTYNKLVGSVENESATDVELKQDELYFVVDAFRSADSSAASMIGQERFDEINKYLDDIYKNSDFQKHRAKSICSVRLQCMFDV